VEVHSLGLAAQGLVWPKRSLYVDSIDLIWVALARKLLYVGAGAVHVGYCVNDEVQEFDCGNERTFVRKRLEPDEEGIRGTVSSSRSALHVDLEGDPHSL
jgi:hypothetical protein